MKYRSFLTAVLSIAIAALCALQASAGTTGAIAGTVTDAATGAPVAASVTATSGSESVRTFSDATGYFEFTGLDPDDYTITVASQGDSTRTTVNVFADEIESLDLTLGKGRRP